MIEKGTELLTYLCHNILRDSIDIERMLKKSRGIVSWPITDYFIFYVHAEDYLPERIVLWCDVLETQNIGKP